MPHTPKQRKRKTANRNRHKIYMRDELWTAFDRVCGLKDSNASAELARHAAKVVRINRALLRSHNFPVPLPT